MASRGIPAASNRASTGGGTSRLGSGRVMSQTEIAARHLDERRATDGRVQRLRDGSCGVVQRNGRPRFRHVVLEALRQFEGQTGSAESKTYLLRPAPKTVIVRKIRFRLP